MHTKPHTRTITNTTHRHTHVRTHADILPPPSPSILYRGKERRSDNSEKKHKVTHVPANANTKAQVLASCWHISTEYKQPIKRPNRYINYSDISIDPHFVLYFISTFMSILNNANICIIPYIMPICVCIYL